MPGCPWMYPIAGCMAFGKMCRWRASDRKGGYAAAGRDPGVAFRYGRALAVAALRGSGEQSRGMQDWARRKESQSHEVGWKG